MTSKSERQERIKFGNWLPTAPATLGGLTLPGWCVLLGGILAVVFSVAIGKPLAGLGVLALALLADLVFVVRFGRLPGRTLAAMLGEHIDQARRIDEGSTGYVTGMFTQLPDEALNAMPGPFAEMQELDGVDGLGARYTLLHHPTPGALAATFVCKSDGDALQPQTDIDMKVSKYGSWLASMSLDDTIAGGVVVVDSALSSSAPLVDRIDRSVAPTAPKVAQQALREAARQLPALDAHTDVYATVVWSTGRIGGDLEDAAAEVAARIPAHREALRDAGAGRVFAATSEELARMVRIAYRPDRSHEFGTDDQTGIRSRTRLTGAGPDSFGDGQRRVCMHDGVASMTAMMLVPPRMHITESFIKTLFVPHRKFLRKRVAMFYRPLDGREAVRRARQLRKATGINASSGSDSAFANHAKNLSGKLESELVSGAAMTRFAIEVTVTFEANRKAYREATQQLKQLLDGVGLEWRFVEVGASAAFHSTLPLGILPWQYKTLLQTLAETSN